MVHVRHLGFDPFAGSRLARAPISSKKLYLVNRMLRYGDLDMSVPFIVRVRRETSKGAEIVGEPVGEKRI